MQQAEGETAGAAAPFPAAAALGYTTASLGAFKRHLHNATSTPQGRASTALAVEELRSKFYQQLIQRDTCAEHSPVDASATAKSTTERNVAKAPSNSWCTSGRITHTECHLNSTDTLSIPRYRGESRVHPDGSVRTNTLERTNKYIAESWSFVERSARKGDQGSTTECGERHPRKRTSGIRLGSCTHPSQTASARFFNTYSPIKNLACAPTVRYTTADVSATAGDTSLKVATLKETPTHREARSTRTLQSAASIDGVVTGGSIAVTNGMRQPGRAETTDNKCASPKLHNKHSDKLGARACGRKESFAVHGGPVAYLAQDKTKSTKPLRTQVMQYEDPLLQLRHHESHPKDTTLMGCPVDQSGTAEPATNVSLVSGADDSGRSNVDATQAQRFPAGQVCLSLSPCLDTRLGALPISYIHGQRQKEPSHLQRRQEAQEEKWLSQPVQQCHSSCERRQQHSGEILFEEKVRLSPARRLFVKSMKRNDLTAPAGKLSDGLSSSASSPTSVSSSLSSGPPPLFSSALSSPAATVENLRDRSQLAYPVVPKEDTGGLGYRGSSNTSLKGMAQDLNSIRKGLLRAVEETRQSFTKLQIPKEKAKDSSKSLDIGRIVRSSTCSRNTVEHTSSAHLGRGATFCKQCRHTKCRCPSSCLLADSRSSTVCAYDCHSGNANCPAGGSCKNGGDGRQSKQNSCRDSNKAQQQGLVLPESQALKTGSSCLAVKPHLSEVYRTTLDNRQPGQVHAQCKQMPQWKLDHPKYGMQPPQQDQRRKHQWNSCDVLRPDERHQDLRGTQQLAQNSNTVLAWLSNDGPGNNVVQGTSGDDKEAITLPGCQLPEQMRHSSDREKRFERPTKQPCPKAQPQGESRGLMQQVQHNQRPSSTSEARSTRSRSSSKRGGFSIDTGEECNWDGTSNTNGKNCRPVSSGTAAETASCFATPQGFHCASPKMAVRDSVGTADPTVIRASQRQYCPPEWGTDSAAAGSATSSAVASRDATSESARSTPPGLSVISKNADGPYTIPATCTAVAMPSAATSDACKSTVPCREYQHDVKVEPSEIRMRRATKGRPQGATQHLQAQQQTLSKDGETDSTGRSQEGRGNEFEKQGAGIVKQRVARYHRHSQLGNHASVAKSQVKDTTVNREERGWTQNKVEDRHCTTLPSPQQSLKEQTSHYAASRVNACSLASVSSPYGDVAVSGGRMIHKHHDIDEFHSQHTPPNREDLCAPPEDVVTRRQASSSTRNDSHFPRANAHTSTGATTGRRRSSCNDVTGMAADVSEECDGLPSRPLQLQHARQPDDSLQMSPSSCSDIYTSRSARSGTSSYHSSRPQSSNNAGQRQWKPPSQQQRSFKEYGSNSFPIGSHSNRRPNVEHHGESPPAGQDETHAHAAHTCQRQTDTMDVEIPHDDTLSQVLKAIQNNTNVQRDPQEGEQQTFETHKCDRQHGKGGRKQHSKVVRRCSVVVVDNLHQDRSTEKETQVVQNQHLRQVTKQEEEKCEVPLGQYLLQHNNRRSDAAQNIESMTPSEYMQPPKHIAGCQSVGRLPEDISRSFKHQKELIHSQTFKTIRAAEQLRIKDVTVASAGNHPSIIKYSGQALTTATHAIPPTAGSKESLTSDTAASTNFSRDAPLSGAILHYSSEDAAVAAVVGTAMMSEGHEANTVVAAGSLDAEKDASGLPTVNEATFMGGDTATVPDAQLPGILRGPHLPGKSSVNKCYYKQYRHQSQAQEENKHFSPSTSERTCQQHDVQHLQGNIVCSSSPRQVDSQSLRGDEVYSVSATAVRVAAPGMRSPTRDSSVCKSTVSSTTSSSAHPVTLGTQASHHRKHLSPLEHCHEQEWSKQSGSVLNVHEQKHMGAKEASVQHQKGHGTGAAFSSPFHEKSVSTKTSASTANPATDLVKRRCPHKPECSSSNGCRSEHRLPTVTGELTEAVSSQIGGDINSCLDEDGRGERRKSICVTSQGDIALYHNVERGGTRCDNTRDNSSIQGIDASSEEYSRTISACRGSVTGSNSRAEGTAVDGRHLLTRKTGNISRMQQPECFTAPPFAKQNSSEARCNLRELDCPMQVKGERQKLYRRHHNIPEQQEGPADRNYSDKTPTGLIDRLQGQTHDSHKRHHSGKDGFATLSQGQCLHHKHSSTKKRHQGPQDEQEPLNTSSFQVKLQNTKRGTQTNFPTPEKTCGTASQSRTIGDAASGKSLSYITEEEQHNDSIETQRSQPSFRAQDPREDAVLSAMSPKSHLHRQLQHGIRTSDETMVQEQDQVQQKQQQRVPVAQNVSVHLEDRTISPQARLKDPEQQSAHLIPSTSSISCQTSTSKGDRPVNPQADGYSTAEERATSMANTWREESIFGQTHLPSFDKEKPTMMETCKLSSRSCDEKAGHQASCGNCYRSDEKRDPKGNVVVHLNDGDHHVNQVKKADELHGPVSRLHATASREEAIERAASAFENGVSKGDTSGCRGRWIYHHADQNNRSSSIGSESEHGGQHRIPCSTEAHSRGKHKIDEDVINDERAISTQRTASNGNQPEAQHNKRHEEVRSGAGEAVPGAVDNDKANRGSDDEIGIKGREHSRAAAPACAAARNEERTGQDEDEQGKEKKREATCLPPESLAPSFLRKEDGWHEVTECKSEKNIPAATEAWNPPSRNSSISNSNSWRAAEMLENLLDAVQSLLSVLEGNAEDLKYQLFKQQLLPLTGTDHRHQHQQQHQPQKEQLLTGKRLQTLEMQEYLRANSDAGTIVEDAERVNGTPKKQRLRELHLQLRQFLLFKNQQHQQQQYSQKETNNELVCCHSGRSQCGAPEPLLIDRLSKEHRQPVPQLRRQEIQNELNQQETKSTSKMQRQTEEVESVVDAHNQTLVKPATVQRPSAAADTNQVTLRGISNLVMPKSCSRSEVSRFSEEACSVNEGRETTGATLPSNTGRIEEPAVSFLEKRGSAGDSTYGSTWKDHEKGSSRSCSTVTIQSVSSNSTRNNTSISVSSSSSSSSSKNVCVVPPALGYGCSKEMELHNGARESVARAAAAVQRASTAAAQAAVAAQAFNEAEPAFEGGIANEVTIVRAATARRSPCIGEATSVSESNKAAQGHGGTDNSLQLSAAAAATVATGIKTSSLSKVTIVKAKQTISAAPTASQALRVNPCKKLLQKEHIQHTSHTILRQTHNQKSSLQIESKQEEKRLSLKKNVQQCSSSGSLTYQDQTHLVTRQPSEHRGMLQGPLDMLTANLLNNETVTGQQHQEVRGSPQEECCALLPVTTTQVQQQRHQERPREQQQQQPKQHQQHQEQPEQQEQPQSVHHYHNQQRQGSTDQEHVSGRFSAATRRTQETEPQREQSAAAAHSTEHSLPKDQMIPLTQDPQMISPISHHPQIWKRVQEHRSQGEQEEPSWQEHDTTQPSRKEQTQSYSEEEHKQSLIRHKGNPQSSWPEQTQQLSQDPPVPMERLQERSLAEEALSMESAKQLQQVKELVNSQEEQKILSSSDARFQQNISCGIFKQHIDMLRANTPEGARDALSVGDLSAKDFDTPFSLSAMSTPQSAVGKAERDIQDLQQVLQGRHEGRIPWIHSSLDQEQRTSLARKSLDPASSVRPSQQQTCSTEKQQQNGEPCGLPSPQPPSLVQSRQEQRSSARDYTAETEYSGRLAISLQTFCERDRKERERMLQQMHSKYDGIERKLQNQNLPEGVEMDVPKGHNSAQQRQQHNYEVAKKESEWENSFQHVEALGESAGHAPCVVDAFADRLPLGVKQRASGHIIVGAAGESSEVSVCVRADVGAGCGGGLGAGVATSSSEDVKAKAAATVANEKAANTALLQDTVPQCLTGVKSTGAGGDDITDDLKKSTTATATARAIGATGVNEVAVAVEAAVRAEAGGAIAVAAAPAQALVTYCSPLLISPTVQTRTGDWKEASDEQQAERTLLEKERKLNESNATVAKKAFSLVERVQHGQQSNASSNDKQTQLSVPSLVSRPPMTAAEGSRLMDSSDVMLRYPRVADGLEAPGREEDDQNVLRKMKGNVQRQTTQATLYCIPHQTHQPKATKEEDNTQDDENQQQQSNSAPLQLEAVESCTDTLQCHRQEEDAQNVIGDAKQQKKIVQHEEWQHQRQQDQQRMKKEQQQEERKAASTMAKEFQQQQSSMLQQSLKRDFYNDVETLPSSLTQETEGCEQVAQHHRCNGQSIKGTEKYETPQQQQQKQHMQVKCDQVKKDILCDGRRDDNSDIAAQLQSKQARVIHKEVNEVNLVEAEEEEDLSQNKEVDDEVNLRENGGEKEDVPRHQQRDLSPPFWQCEQRELQVQPVEYVVNHRSNNHNKCQQSGSQGAEDTGDLIHSSDEIEVELSPFSSICSPGCSLLIRDCSPATRQTPRAATAVPTQPAGGTTATSVATAAASAGAISTSGAGAIAIATSSTAAGAPPTATASGALAAKAAAAATPAEATPAAGAGAALPAALSPCVASLDATDGPGGGGPHSTKSPRDVVRATTMPCYAERLAVRMRAAVPADDALEEASSAGGVSSFASRTCEPGIVHRAAEDTESKRFLSILEQMLQESRRNLRPVVKTESQSQASLRQQHVSKQQLVPPNRGKQMQPEQQEQAKQESLQHCESSQRTDSQQQKQLECLSEHPYIQQREQRPREAAGQKNKQPGQQQQHQDQHQSPHHTQEDQQPKQEDKERHSQQLQHGGQPQQEHPSQHEQAEELRLDVQPDCKQVLPQRGSQKDESSGGSEVLLQPSASFLDTKSPGDRDEKPAEDTRRAQFGPRVEFRFKAPTVSPELLSPVEAAVTVIGPRHDNSTKALATTLPLGISAAGVGGNHSTAAAIASRATPTTPSPCAFLPSAAKKQRGRSEQQQRQQQEQHQQQQQQQEPQRPQQLQVQKQSIILGRADGKEVPCFLQEPQKQAAAGNAEVQLKLATLMNISSSSCNAVFPNNAVSPVIRSSGSSSGSNINCSDSSSSSTSITQKDIQHRPDTQKGLNLVNTSASVAAAGMTASLTIVPIQKTLPVGPPLHVAQYLQEMVASPLALQIKKKSCESLQAPAAHVPAGKAIPSAIGAVRTELDPPIMKNVTGQGGTSTGEKREKEKERTEDFDANGDPVPTAATQTLLTAATAAKAVAAASAPAASEVQKSAAEVESNTLVHTAALKSATTLTDTTTEGDSVVPTVTSLTSTVMMGDASTRNVDMLPSISAGVLAHSLSLPPLTVSVAKDISVASLCKSPVCKKTDVSAQSTSGGVEANEVRPVLGGAEGELTVDELVESDFLRKFSESQSASMGDKITGAIITENNSMYSQKRWRIRKRTASVIEEKDVAENHRTTLSASEIAMSDTQRRHRRHSLGGAVVSLLKNSKYRQNNGNITNNSNNNENSDVKHNEEGEIERRGFNRKFSFSMDRKNMSDNTVEQCERSTTKNHNDKNEEEERSHQPQAEASIVKEDINKNNGEQCIHQKSTARTTLAAESPACQPPTDDTRLPPDSIQEGGGLIIKRHPSIVFGDDIKTEEVDNLSQTIAGVKVEKNCDGIPKAINEGETKQNENDKNNTIITSTTDTKRTTITTLTTKSIIANNEEMNSPGVRVLPAAHAPPASMQPRLSYPFFKSFHARQMQRQHQQPQPQQPHQQQDQQQHQPQQRQQGNEQQQQHEQQQQKELNLEQQQQPQSHVPQQQKQYQRQRSLRQLLSLQRRKSIPASSGPRTTAVGPERSISSCCDQKEEEVVGSGPVGQTHQTVMVANASEIAAVAVPDDPAVQNVSKTSSSSAVRFFSRRSSSSGAFISSDTTTSAPAAPVASVPVGTTTVLAPGLSSSTSVPAAARLSLAGASTGAPADAPTVVSVKSCIISKTANRGIIWSSPACNASFSNSSAFSSSNVQCFNAAAGPSMAVNTPLAAAAAAARSAAIGQAAAVTAATTAGATTAAATATGTATAAVSTSKTEPAAVTTVSDKMKASMQSKHMVSQNVDKDSTDNTIQWYRHSATTTTRITTATIRSSSSSTLPNSTNTTQTTSGEQKKDISGNKTRRKSSSSSDSVACEKKVSRFFGLALTSYTSRQQPQ